MSGAVSRSGVHFWGRGRPWDGIGVRTQDERLPGPILIAGCFAEGRWGGCGVKPGFVCLSLSDPTPGPLPDLESPLPGLGDAKAIRGLFERNRDCIEREGGSRRRNPTTTSHRRVMGVEKDSEGRRGCRGGRPGGRGSQPGPDKSGAAGGPRGMRKVPLVPRRAPLRGSLRSWEKRTSAELSLCSLLNLPLLFFGIGRAALTKMSV